VLKTFPAAVQDEVGYALFSRSVARSTLRPSRSSVSPRASWKWLLTTGGDTFRAVYTVRKADRVFVLHAFQKKSKHGLATPQPEIDLIKRRLKQAIAISEGKE
jgi:phage-related protein